MTDKQGVSRRKSLERFVESAKRRGRSEAEIEKFSAELKLPTLHPGTEYLYDTFLQLSSTRPVGQYGPLAIPFSEIKVASDLLGLDLTPWEVQVIRQADAVFLGEHYDHNNRNREAHGRVKD